MKKLIAVLFLGMMSLGLYAQDKKVAKIEFKTELIDYGTIEKGADGVRVFEFTNTGNAPLIISNVKSTCGCTVPKFPKEPIKPGATGEIEVVYSPGKQQGAQTKTVTITANTDPIITTLNISANVEAPEL